MRQKIAPLFYFGLTLAFCLANSVDAPAQSAPRKAQIRSSQSETNEALELRNRLASESIDVPSDRESDALRVRKMRELAGPSTTISRETPFEPNQATTSRNLIVNGGFEDGTAPWQISGGFITTVTARSGRSALSLGGEPRTTDTGRQNVVIPPDCTSITLSYGLRVLTDESRSATTSSDILGVWFEPLNSPVEQQNLIRTQSDRDAFRLSGWTLVGPLSISPERYRGRTCSLLFRGSNDVLLDTFFLLDDVSLVVTTPTATCTYSLSPTLLTFAPEGGAQVFTVRTTSNNCPWTARSNASWATITVTQGTDTGNVTVNAQANSSSSARQGTISVTAGTQTITLNIEQRGVPAALECSATVATETLTVRAVGETASVRVTPRAGCAFGVTTSSDWIRVSTSTVTEPTNLSIEVRANTTALPRSGTVRVGNAVVLVTQDPAILFTMNIQDRIVTLDASREATIEVQIERSEDFKDALEFLLVCPIRQVTLTPVGPNPVEGDTFSFRISCPGLTEETSLPVRLIARGPRGYERAIDLRIQVAPPSN